MTILLLAIFLSDGYLAFGQSPDTMDLPQQFYDWSTEILKAQGNMIMKQILLFILAISISHIRWSGCTEH